MFGKPLSAHQLGITRFSLAGGAANRDPRPSARAREGFPEEAI